MTGSDFFFCVWCPNTSKPMTRKFANIGQAIAVRNKLKQDNPDRDFHILVHVPEPVIALFQPAHVEDSESP